MKQFWNTFWAAGILKILINSKYSWYTVKCWEGSVTDSYPVLRRRLPYISQLPACLINAPRTLSLIIPEFEPATLATHSSSLPCVSMLNHYTTLLAIKKQVHWCILVTAHKTDMVHWVRHLVVAIPVTRWSRPGELCGLRQTITVNTRYSDDTIHT